MLTIENNERESLNTCYKQLITTELRGKLSVITQLFTKNALPNGVLNEFNMVTLQPDALEQATILPKPLFNHLLYLYSCGVGAEGDPCTSTISDLLFPPLISNP
jgi:hypothetical protein